MSEIKEHMLGNIAEFIDYRGKTPLKTTSGVPLITAKIVKNGFIQAPNEFISKEDYLKWMTRGFPKVGDVVLTTEAPLGEVAQIKDASFALAQRIITIRGKERLLDNGYLKYFLQSTIGQHRLKERETGTTVTGIKSSELKKVIISAPSFDSQKSISEILSSLDDKIELNNKINQELESLAQLLFKRWFVDFEFPNENGEPYKSSGGKMEDSELGEIPKGWKLDKLEKIVTKSHTGADAITRAPIVDYDTGIKCARVGDLTNKRSYLNWAFCKINPQDYERHKLEEGDIIVTRTATLGINQLVRKSIDAVCNNGLIRLKLDKKVCHPNFVFIQLQSDSYKEYIERISGDSSTRPNMQMDYLLDFKIILPESSLVIKFSELLNNIYNQIDACKLENEALVNTRDALLPKLISGELQINEN